MNRNHFQEIRLHDFRCFHDEQMARLAPLTLLVGDNSTGKTSFLAAVRAVWEVAFHQTEPDFREPPDDLGAFPEIAHNRSDGKNRLYFQREDLDIRIHSIRVDDEGSVLDAPEGYRRFFQDELNRVISY